MAPNGAFGPWWDHSRCSITSVSMKVVSAGNTFESKGGAVDNAAMSTALVGGGLAVTSIWGICSTVHTLISTPVISLVTLGAGSAAVAGGVYTKGKGFKQAAADVAETLKNVTPNAAASAAA